MVDANIVVVSVEHIIDCDCDPITPDWLVVKEHKKCGQLSWSPDLIGLQTHYDGFMDISAQSAAMRLANVNVRDFQCRNQGIIPGLIPADWREKKIFYFATIYRCRRSDRLFVPSLEYFYGRWVPAIQSLDLKVRQYEVAVLMSG